MQQVARILLGTWPSGSIVERTILYIERNLARFEEILTRKLVNTGRHDAQSTRFEVFLADALTDFFALDTCNSLVKFPLSTS